MIMYELHYRINACGLDANLAVRVPREIVSPLVIEVTIQEDGWKQAELEGEGRSALTLPKSAC